MPSRIESKLLIVDDLPDNLVALEALIRAPMCPVFRATSAEEALALLLEHEFALAILDVQMPSMNGFQLAELMRGTERTSHIPIIFVSAAGRENNYAFKGYESGAVDFLQKPLDPHAVTSKVSVFVDLYRHRKALRREIEALAASHREQEALVEQLRIVQQELEHAVRMRDDFMSLVSHELRTPLNTLYLEAQVRKLHLSRNDLTPFAPDRLSAMIERDERQIRNMVRLIDDMLDVSRVRSGALSLKLEPMDLCALTRNVVACLMQQAEAAGCTINLKAECEVWGRWDEFRIEQVLTNLLTNAIRYGSGHGNDNSEPIEISVEANGGIARLCVRDHGMGIAPEDQERIFEQFQRADGSRRHTPGLGLGLYIARQIVQAHHGRITLESSPNKGAFFCVELPLEGPPGPNEETAPSTQQH